MRQLGMFVPKKTHLADNFRRASVEAFPTSFTLMDTNKNGRQTKVVVKKFMYHN
jgi:hypothetical protein